MNLRLHDVTSDDCPLIERWLQADHVRTDWGDPDANIRLLRDPPGIGSWRAVIEAGGRKVGLGVGSATLRLVAETVLSDAEVPFVMACMRMDNLASQRACAKAGFRRDREFDDVPNGRYVLMVCHRQEAGSI